MADWRLENKQATLIRYGGSWSPKGAIRKMSLMDAINWLNKYGYKAVKARDLKRDVGGPNKIDLVVVGRQIDYRKTNCNTSYTMSIYF